MRILANEIRSAEAVQETQGPRGFGAALLAALQALEEQVAELQRQACDLQGSCLDAEQFTLDLSGSAAKASSEAQLASMGVTALSQSMMQIGSGVEEQAALSTRLNESSAASSEAVAALSSQAEEIGGLVRVIGDIASQTDLLSLNAAIEAARSGAGGTGFSVVAQEIKNLAGQTAGAASRVCHILEAVVERANGADVSLNVVSRTVAAMDRATNKIVGAVLDQRTGAQTIVMQSEECADEVEVVAEKSGRLFAAATRSNATASDLSGGLAALLSAIQALRATSASWIDQDEGKAAASG